MHGLRGLRCSQRLPAQKNPSMSMDSLPRCPDYHDALAVAGLVAGRMIKKRCTFRVSSNPSCSGQGGLCCERATRRQLANSPGIQPRQGDLYHARCSYPQTSFPVLRLGAGGLRFGLRLKLGCIPHVPFSFLLSVCSFRGIEFKRNCQEKRKWTLNVHFWRHSFVSS